MTARTFSHPLLAAAFVAGLAASLASAQDSKSSEPNPLRGPAVKEPAAPATLVERDMSGHLTRLDSRPEEAALAHLTLTPEQRAAAEKVVAARFAKVSQLLADHTDLFLKIQNARQSGGAREEIAPLVRELRQAAGPLFEPPYAEQLRDVLPESQRAGFTRLVEEYKKVAATEEPAGAQGQRPPSPDADVKPGSRSALAERMAPARTEMNLLLREMARALKSVVTDRRERFDELIKIVDATPEQTEKLQAIVREKGKDGLRPSAADLAEKQRKIMEVLTPEQRRKLLAARRDKPDAPK